MSASWFQAVAIGEFPDDGKFATKLGEWNVLIVREDGAFTAFNDCCTHQASALSTGRVRRGTIMCPLHGARFDARTGSCIGGAYPALRKFDTRESEGMLEVELPDQPPEIGERPKFG
jgi:3-phenylpropionate/trans-cinnamate dioxygenase ferredoxin subunit|tara:strand:- start:1210 stop:1560 length:351 start_codon:yes stop_codon:yes gene_type:complete